MNYNIDTNNIPSALLDALIAAGVVKAESIRLNDELVAFPGRLSAEIRTVEGYLYGSVSIEELDAILAVADRQLAVRRSRENPIRVYVGDADNARAVALLLAAFAPGLVDHKGRQLLGRLTDASDPWTEKYDYLHLRVRQTEGPASGNSFAHENEGSGETPLADFVQWLTGDTVAGDATGTVTLGSLRGYSQAHVNPAKGTVSVGCQVVAIDAIRELADAIA